jgi:cytochrome c peroxidase
VKPAHWPLLLATLLLIGAGLPWTWSLPPGEAPPPVPVGNAMGAAKVELGRRLFYDADLSANGTLSCAGCHEQHRGFADGNRTRPGVHGDPGLRNVPGLANVAWLPRLTIADPAITSLEAQVAVPLLGEHPIEMGMKGMEAELPRRLGADACYRRMFARAFPEHRGRIDIATVSAALAAFERTLISLDSPHDRARRGQADALSMSARQGERLFADKGCASCHAGRDFSDGAYHRLEPATAADPGLAEKTGLASDAGRFRTPPLRNVAVTGPWWHDGSAQTLDVAILRHGRKLTDPERIAIRAFLDSLTDRTFLTDPRFAMPDEACGKTL